MLIYVSNTAKKFLFKVNSKADHNHNKFAILSIKWLY